MAIVLTRTPLTTFPLSHDWCVGLRVDRSATRDWKPHLHKGEPDGDQPTTEHAHTTNQPTFNYMIGPSSQVLINIGARYVP